MKNAIKKICLFTMLLISVSGCTPETEIAQHKIPKDRSGLEGLRNAQNPSSPQTSAKQAETRMIVGLFEETDATWFFKIAGEPEKIESTKEHWEPLFKNVTFKDGNPEFELPEGWTETAPKPMRFKTLIMGDSKLELAISNLSPDQDLLLNANRWRKQIGLPRISGDEIDSQLPLVKTESGKFRLFDQTGVGSGKMQPPFAGGGMAAPFAGGGAAPFAGGNQIGNQATGNQAATSSSKVEFETPDGWESGRTSSMVQARLKKTAESGEAQITIIEMPADANEWQPNVVRWAGQVEMGGLSTEELEELTSEITVDGASGKLVKLIDLDAESSKNAVIAGMVKRNGSAWFLKMSGEKKLVVESQEEFMTFVKSIKFK